MDGSNPAILTQLAEVAEAAGDLERAERAYRTLLVQTRDEAARARRPPEARRAGLAADGDPAAPLRPRAQARARRRGRRAARLRARRGDQGPGPGVAAAARAAGARRPRRARAAVREAARARGRHARRRRRSPRRWPRACARRASRRPPSRRSCGRSSPRPELARLHAPLVELARAAGQLQPLVERLLALVERRRRKADMGVAATLLLLAADIAERDFGDQTRALDLHRRAEEMQPRSFDVLTGIARLAQQQGERRRVRSRGARVQARAPARRAARRPPRRRCTGPPRWSSARAETREAGIASLSRGDREERRSRTRGGAGRRRGRARRGAGEDPAALRAHRPRSPATTRVLLDYLERRVATPDVDARAKCARRSTWRWRSTASDRMEPLLVRLADVAAERADGRDDATWALFELLRIKKAAGDLDAAAHILQRAAELLPLDRVMPLARDLAERAGRAGNRRLGAELLERLRTSAPADESVWRPLARPLRQPARPRRPRPPGRRRRCRCCPTSRRGISSAWRSPALRLAEDGGDGAAAAILQDVLLEERRPRGGARAAGRLLRAQRLRGRPGRPAGAGVRGGDRGARSATASSRRRFAWAACSNARTPSARPRPTSARWPSRPGAASCSSACSRCGPPATPPASTPS